MGNEMKNTYFLDSMRAQEKWRIEDSINLLPSENQTSPQVRALLSSEFVNRYTLPLNSDSGGEFIENAYRGTRITTEVERKAEEGARGAFHTKAAGDIIRKRRPKLVILGASLILFPYDMKPIRDACDDAGSTLVYDGSHVMGLIAGGEFQSPLKEGAEILYGSTHKSFFGPQGGIILTNSKDLDRSVRKNLTWRIVDKVLWNRVASMGHALLEMRAFGPKYAKQVIKNSQRLGRELKERGFPIMFEELGFSRSHQLLYDVKEVRAIYGLGLNDFSIRMEKSNLIIDSVDRKS